nr:ABC transporter permease [Actinomycetota bacterium]
RDYLIQVPLNDLRSQNAHTLLGSLWLVLNPLLQVGVYFLVFGVIMPIDRGVDSYLVFLTIGVFTFFYSQRVISDGARSVVTSLGLIRTLRFPRATLPIANTVGQALSFGPVLAVMVVVVLAHGNLPTWRWLLLPVLFTLQTMFSLGGSFATARFNHLYRDLENLLPFVFRLLFYVSGVLYSVDHYIDDPLVRTLFLLNPMYCYVTAWRWVMVGNSASGAVMAATAIWAVVSLTVGFALFRSGESSYGGTG